MEWLFGIRLFVYPRVETCRALYVTGDYEPNELWHLRQMLTRGMVLIDVGANLGLYALLAAALVGDGGTVIAIEPSTREFHRLSANIELNRKSNVRAIRVALSDHKGEQELLVFGDEHSGHNTLGAPRYAGVRPERLEHVQTETLDDLVLALGLGRIDILKIDVEGHEFEVLKGSTNALQRYRPVVLIEILEPLPEDESQDREQVFELLDKMGYALFRFDESTALLRFAARRDTYRGNFVAVPRDGEWLASMTRRGQIHGMPVLDADNRGVVSESYVFPV